MKECAFCLKLAELSAEHVTSQWMGRMFPTRKLFKRTDYRGTVREYPGKGLPIKAKVVCQKCNNGWMSDIENNHAKPVMAPLMLGKVPAPFGPSEARSLAIFAFKTAVVLDHEQVAEQHREPFFSRRYRDAFRRHLLIPPNVNMWLAPYAPSLTHRRFDLRVSYVDGMEPLPGYPLELFVCTVGIGGLAFQVVAHKQMRFVIFKPRLSDFDHLGVPFWPTLQPSYVWPGPVDGFLTSHKQFIAFSRRWREVVPVPGFR